jgi:hypothetical protein
MATSDPKATVAAQAKPPAPPAPPVEPDDELDDVNNLIALIPEDGSRITNDDAETAPMVETVNISGLVMEKTVAPDGECETRVIRQPMIAAEQIRATKASQRDRGH